MFNFTISYFGFLKFIPGVPHFFDMWLKTYTFITRPQLLDLMDDIENRLSQWPDVKISAHKYGGMQFNCGGKEIGHVHGNGLLDMLLSRQLKQHLMQDGRIVDHHHFKNNGWFSFYIKDSADRDYAVALLKIGYERLACRRLN